MGAVRNCLRWRAQNRPPVRQPAPPAPSGAPCIDQRLSHILDVIYDKNSMAVRCDVLHKYSPSSVTASSIVSMWGRYRHRLIDNMALFDRVKRCVMMHDGSAYKLKTGRKHTAVRQKEADYFDGHGWPLRRRWTQGYIWPSFRSVSMPRPSSCARPARSALVVVRNSVIICGMVAAHEGTVPVQGTQPRLR